MASLGGCAAASCPQRRAEAADDHVLDELGAHWGPASIRAGDGVARLKQATATSSGGIVIRFVGQVPQLVVGRRRRERDGVTWSLPKGTPIPGETSELTALREVREETGLEVRIVRPFDAIAYTFVQSRTRIAKTVDYFLMIATGGDLEQHDHEFDEVRWIGFDEAQVLLSFETERALVARAASVAVDGTFAAGPSRDGGTAPGVNG